MRTSPDAAMDPNVSVRILRSIEEIERVRQLWKAWGGHRDSDIDFFKEIVLTWTEVLRPHVVVIYRGERADAMLIGRLENTRLDSKIGYLKLPGMAANSLIFSYGGLRGNASAANCEEFVRSIMKTLSDGDADMALLDHAQTDSPLYKFALKMPGFGSRDHLGKPECHYTMALAGNIEDVYRDLSRNHRSELRRKAKKLLTDHKENVRVECVRDSSELDGAMARVEEIAKRTYQRGLGVGFRESNEIRKRLRVCAEKGWLRMYMLHVADKPCAFWIGTVNDGSFCSDYLAFDESLGDYSPGTFLLTKVLEDFCATGVTGIDFGYGGGRYKERFGNRPLMEASVYLFAPSLKGFALNSIRTTTGVTRDVLSKALERTKILPWIKRRWRKKVTQGTVEN